MQKALVDMAVRLIEEFVTMEGVGVVLGVMVLVWVVKGYCRGKKKDCPSYLLRVLSVVLGILLGVVFLTMDLKWQILYGVIYGGSTTTVVGLWKKFVKRGDKR